MHRDLEVVARDATVVDSAIRMRERSIGSVLVGSGEPGGGRPKIVGIVTETDLVHKVIAQGLNASQTKVARIMARPLLTITPEKSLLDASHLMEINHVRHLCVSEGGSIVGLISVRDLVRYFVDAETGPVRELGDVYRPLSVLMRTSIETIDNGETLLAAARRMAEKHIGSLLVSQHEKLVGIVTESDMVRKALAYNLDAGLIRVGSLMNQPVIDIDINRTIHDASELMAEKGVRHLAVTEIHKIVGILSVRDLVRMISVRDRPRFLREKGK
ncbi:MAG: CBS domain-containing protein [Nitrospiraceae bacterium]